LRYLPYRSASGFIPLAAAEHPRGNNRHRPAVLTETNPVPVSARAMPWPLIVAILPLSTLLRNAAIS
jgi:hypothetical protein